MLVAEVEGSRSSSGHGRPSAGGEWGTSPASGRDRIVEAAISAGSRAGDAATDAGADALDLRVGDDVRHAKWGEGVVLELSGAGDKTEVVVNFPDAGEKRLLLSWAPLERV